MNNNLKKAPLFFDRGDPFFSTSPGILDAGITALKNEKTHYIDPCGMLTLRQTLSRDLYEESGLSYDPEEEILVTSGASIALYSVFSVFTRPGDRILIPDLYWPPYFRMAGLVKGKPDLYKWPLERSEDAEKESVEDLLVHLGPDVRFLVINSPHNPSGRMIGKTWLHRLAAVIHQFPGLIIIADETYYALILGNKEHMSPAEDKRLFSRTILVRSFSKTFAMTGWRIGYLAGPRDLIRPLKALQSVINTGSSSIAQEAVNNAFSGKKEMIAWFRTRYTKNCDFLVKELNKEFCFSCESPEAGIYLFPTIRGLPMDDHGFVQALKESENVHLYPGSVFGEPGKNRVRICFAQPFSLIKEFILRMKEFIKKFPGR